MKVPTTREQALSSTAPPNAWNIAAPVQDAHHLDAVASRAKEDNVQSAKDAGH
jgi:hypothetical protein